MTKQFKAAATGAVSWPVYCTGTLTVCRAMSQKPGMSRFAKVHSCLYFIVYGVVSMSHRVEGRGILPRRFEFDCGQFLSLFLSEQSKTRKGGFFI